MAIPRTIHQLWIGSKEMPNREREWCAEWKGLHPSWQYKLHGNELIERYRNDPYVSWLLENEKLAFVADRLRVLILRDEGGIYLDCDCLPVRKLDTLSHILDMPHMDFVTGLRNPDIHRPMPVALHRGVPLVDNTVMMSAQNGAMAQRLCALYRPEAKKQTGYSFGIEILRHADYTCALLNYRYFYSMREFPETVLLHDGHNAGTWCDQTPKLQPVPQRVA